MFIRGLHSRILLIGCLAIVSCSTGGSSPLSGCAGGCVTPLATPYTGPKTNDAVDLHISGDGFSYVNANWQQLLKQFTTNPIQIPIACTTANLPGGLDNSIICDQDSAGNDRGDSSCPATGAACNVTVTIQNFSLTPQDVNATATGTITGAATLVVQAPFIDIRTLGDPIECIDLDDLSLQLSFDNSSDPLPLSLDVDFTLDPRVDSAHPALTFNVTNINGLSNLNVADLGINGENTCGDIYAGIIDFATSLFPSIINDIIGALQSQLDSAVESAVDAQLCRKCGSAGMESCPSPSTCSASTDGGSGTCMLSSGCVPLLLGEEGEFSPASLLGQFGVPANSAVDFSVAAGGSVSSAGFTSPNSGLTLGVIGGLEAIGPGPLPYTAACVPPATGPIGSDPGVPDFDGNAPDGGYEVGLAISSLFLNQALFQAQQAGALCLALDSSTISVLNTGLFSTFLPSLALVAGSTTQNAPMLIALRPLTPPTINVGLGTVDPTTGQPVDPLLTISLQNTVIDIYALIEDRWSRLFSLQVDLTLPLSLIIDGCPQTVTPAIGSLSNLITISKAPYNSNILAENPSILAGLLPAVINLAQPALASALKPISVPTASGFGLYIASLKGVGLQAGTADTYNDLGVYGNLEIVPDGGAISCEASSVKTTAKLVGVDLPPVEKLKLVEGQTLPLPVARIQASATGTDGRVIYDYRVDDGLWTMFQKSSLLSVSDPRFLAQGHHKVDVRGRPAGKGISDPNPPSVDVLIDWTPPTVHLTPNNDTNSIAVEALDNVTAASALQYAYQVGDEAMGPFGSARPIDLRAVNELGRLVVAVRDEAGNVGKASYTAPIAVEPSAPGAALSAASNSPGSSRHNSSCASTSGFSLTALALGLWLTLGRRRRH